MKNVTVFTSPTCPHCKTAKEYLNSNSIEYIERDVKADKEARKELMSKGIMGVPVIVIDDEYIVGFDRAKLDATLGL